MSSTSTYITRSILSAKLIAEGALIRSLRRKARRHRALARKLTQAHEHWAEHNNLARRLRGATVCPSERARCANLALGYLKGRPYLSIEHKTHTPACYMVGTIAKEVAKKADVHYQEIVQWIQGKAEARKAA